MSLKSPLVNHRKYILIVLSTFSLYRCFISEGQRTVHKNDVWRCDAVQEKFHRTPYRSNRR